MSFPAVESPSEVFADNVDQMISQGVDINKWGKNVYVKIPVVNSKNKLTKVLIKDEIFRDKPKKILHYCNKKKIGLYFPSTNLKIKSLL